MSRRPIIAGNWKMNLGLAQARTLALQCCDMARGHPGVDVAVFPAHLTLASVAEALRSAPASCPVIVGAQNFHAGDDASGAYTGEVSAAQVLDAGATAVLIGHSERRRLFHEDGTTLKAKLLMAGAVGLRAIYCICETLEQRESGQAAATVLQQLSLLELLPAAHRVLIDVAYEPVWAIGTGRTATPSQAGEIHALLREGLDRIGGFGSARLLYGGSVKPDNAASLAATPHVEGFLVGGASLKGDSFGAIIANAAGAFRP